MTPNDGDSYLGHFDLSGKQVSGRLVLEADQTRLTLYSPDSLEVSEKTIHGRLSDGSLVSLHDCVSFGTTTHGTQDGATYTCDIFPHFVTLGPTYSDAATQFRSIVFKLRDSETIFPDTTAFRTIFEPKLDLLNQLTPKKEPRTTELGDFAHVSYYTGKREIMSVNTTIGRVSARHAPTIKFASSRGFSASNNVLLEIEFDRSCSLKRAAIRLMWMQRFFSLLIGEPQTASRVKLEKSDQTVSLNIYQSIPLKLNPRQRDRHPHPVDLLINPMRNIDEFGKVLTSWLARNESWSEARSRYFSGFLTFNQYTLDRLIGAANCFDLLPEDSVPKTAEISPELACARKSAQALFRSLPPSDERSSVLGELGRIGRPKLKQKVRHRANIIHRAIPNQLPDLDCVIGEAINARNHLVHGSELSFDLYANNRLSFLTELLEFVFGASDLVEGGWDIARWISTPSLQAHPFSSFVHTYEQNRRRFETAQ